MINRLDLYISEHVGYTNSVNVQKSLLGVIKNKNLQHLVFVYFYVFFYGKEEVGQPLLPTLVSEPGFNQLERGVGPFHCCCGDWQSGIDFG